MGIMELGDARDAVSSMQVLHGLMTEELDDIELRISELEQSHFADSAEAIEEMRVYGIARAALYSGLASINEVLGWVNLVAEKDEEGNVADVVRSLPTVPVFSIQ